MSARFQNAITVLRYVPTNVVLIGVSVGKVFNYVEIEDHAEVRFVL